MHTIRMRRVVMGGVDADADADAVCELLASCLRILIVGCWEYLSPYTVR